MNSITRLVAIYAVGLVLMLPTTPSWGQPVCASPGCNPTTSDANNNTAGGTETLTDVSATGGVLSRSAIEYTRASSRSSFDCSSTGQVGPADRVRRSTP